MITMRDFMETVEYRITEGSDYGWTCYGADAYTLDSWSGDNDDGYSISIVFDLKTQVVYEMDACDYRNQRAYRWIHPDYKNFHNTEATDRMVNINEAWDDIMYVELEIVKDMLDKASAIVDGEDYDTRVSIPIDLSEEELLVLFKLAHERDMTFNAFVEEALVEALKDFERNPERMKVRAQTMKSSIPHGY